MRHLIDMINGKRMTQRGISMNVQQWVVGQEYLRIDMERKHQ